MNAFSSPPESTTQHDDDEDPVDRADFELDAIFALEAADEAVDVVFAAIRSAQRTLHGISDDASPAKVRNEWRAHNLLTRQATRLVDERLRQLARSIRRLNRVD